MSREAETKMFGNKTTGQVFFLNKYSTCFQRCDLLGSFIVKECPKPTFLSVLKGNKGGYEPVSFFFCSLLLLQWGRSVQNHIYMYVYAILHFCLQWATSALITYSRSRSVSTGHSMPTGMRRSSGRDTGQKFHPVSGKWRNLQGLKQ